MAMSMHRWPAGLILLLAATGCSSNQPFIADKSVWVSPSVSVSYEALAGAALAGAIIWYVADPMAPTWGVSLEKLAGDHYRISLRQKNFALGGDGEARQVFHRAAERLAGENGFAGYNILNYTESLESGPLLDQRTSRGIIQLTNAPEMTAAF